MLNVGRGTGLRAHALARSAGNLSDVTEVFVLPDVFPLPQKEGSEALNLPG